jgi:type II secretory pathway component PulF
MLKTYKREYEVTDISKFEEIYKLSDILRELNFNDSVITLISAGEKSGDMSAMLDTAAQTLQDQQEMQKRANQGLKGSLIMMTFALILLITLPLTLGDVIAEIINQPDMHIATNSITDFFLFMSYALREYWPIIIMIIILTMYFRGIIWLKLRPLPLFKQVWELQKINRSINFLSSYRPFTLAGIDSLTTMRILSENAQGETQKVFTKMASDLKSGVSISTAIDNENFVQLLRIGFGSFERTTEKSQIKIITSLERSLVNINEIYSTKISVFLKTLAMIVTAAMVIMLFMGVILPLQSITAS